MSRKYLNERWCVRCSRSGATPYLNQKFEWLVQQICPIRDQSELPQRNSRFNVIDIGCGNGRNSEFVRKHGVENVVAFDMVNDYGHKLLLGKELWPIFSACAHLVLANYVFMFLNQLERRQIYREIKRVLVPGGGLLVELYPAKDSFCNTDQACNQLLEELRRQFNSWSCVHRSKNRMILRKA